MALLVIATALAASAAWRSLSSDAGKSERFSDGHGQDAPPAGDDRRKKDASYANRLHVIQSFDAVLSRKPTSSELDKYSRLPSEQAIKDAIVRDLGDRCESHEDSGSVDAEASSYSSSSDDDDDDDEGSSCGGPRRRHDKACEVVPYSPDRVHRADAAPADLASVCMRPCGTDAGTEADGGKGGGKGGRGEKGGGGGGGGGSARQEVCIDRDELVKRIDAVAVELEQFRNFVAML